MSYTTATIEKSFSTLGLIVKVLAVFKSFIDSLIANLSNKFDQDLGKLPPTKIAIAINPFQSSSFRELLQHSFKENRE